MGNDTAEIDLSPPRRRAALERNDTEVLFRTRFRIEAVPWSREDTPSHQRAGVQQ